MWPKWGQYIETGGEDGTEVDLPEAEKLQDLMDGVARIDRRHAARTRIWERDPVNLWSDQVYTIGTVAGIPQPVVVAAGICRTFRSAACGLSIRVPVSASTSRTRSGWTSPAG